MDSDPYTPPDSTFSDLSESKELLYSPEHVAFATLLGSPIAGCWLMSKNYAVFGDHQTRREVLMWGAMSTIALFGIASVLPASFPKPILPMASTFALYQCAKSYQGQTYEEYLEKGHQKHSSLSVAGIGIAWLVVILIVFMAVVLLMPS